MAISNSDGSIILSTKVDERGLKAWFASVNSSAKTAKANIAGIGMQATASAKTAKTAIASVGTALKSLLPMLIGVQTIIKAIDFSKKAGAAATQTEASVQRLVDIYGTASESVGNFIDQNSKALGLSKSVGASIASTYGNLLSVWADQATNAELTNALLNQTAVVASRTGRTTEDVAERIRSGLLGNTEAIEDLGINVNIKTIEITDAFKRIADGRSWEQLNAYEQAQVRTLAILEQSTEKYGDTVADTSATIRNKFNAAYEDFQNSWGTIVNTVLLPVLQTLTEIFNIATAGLNALSGRSGKILEYAETNADVSKETADNIKDQADNQKDLNDQMKKTLAGFDDIQILSAQTAENTQSTEFDKIITQGEGNTTPDGSAYVDEINETLAAIMKTVAISMIAIGLILLFTGNAGWGIGAIIFGLGLEGVSVAAITETDPSPTIISSLLTLQGVAVGASVGLGCMMIYMGNLGLGVGLIAYGAFQMGATIYEISQFSTSPVENIITTVQTVAAGAMLAIGFFLLYFKSFMPLAISLIAGGGILLVDKVLDIVEGGVSPEISRWIEGIQLLVEGAALVIGIILLATKVNVPLGVSLIATGAATLAKEVVVNWDAIKEILTDEKFAGWFALAGFAALVLGVLLCFVNLPLGIALIAVGATTLVTVTALNWDTIVTNIKNFLFENSELIALISGGLLILGILLCATGVAIPLGIALIAAGATGLVTVTALNWDSIVEWVKGAWDAVKEFWNDNIAPVFTAEWWLNLGKTCINGLIAGFEGGINGIIEAFESMINLITRGLNKISFSLPDWGWLPNEVQGKSFGINIPSVNLSKVSIPRLAQGAVIPPNREFLAVLGDQKQGTNIETPLATMVEAFQMALDSRGSQSAGNTEVVLEIDGREFGRAVVEQGNRENRRIGTRLVIV